MNQAKDYLNGYRNLLEKLIQKNEKLIELKCKAENIGIGSMGTDKIQTSSNPDKICVSVIKILEAEKEVQTAKNDLIHFEQTARNRINKLSNDDLKKLLKLKYFNLMSYSEIAKKLNVSKQWVIKLHKRALQEFNYIFFKI